MIWSNIQFKNVEEKFLSDYSQKKFAIKVPAPL